MARGRLSNEEKKILKENVYVSDVEEDRIIYTNEFKFHFMKEYLIGKKPTQIFMEAGFDPKILGSKRIERAAHRWRESYGAGSLGKYKDGTIRKRQKNEEEEAYREDEFQRYLELIEKLQKEIEALRTQNIQLKEKLAEYC